MAYDQYGNYPPQQQRPYYNQGPPRQQGRGGPTLQREADPYMQQQNGYGQGRQRANPRVESYVGYDGDILDSYGTDEYDAGGYNAQYEQPGYGPGGQHNYANQPARQAPQQYREPPRQGRDPRAQDMSWQGGGGRGQQSHDYAPQASGSRPNQRGYRPQQQQNYPPGQSYGAPQEQDYNLARGGPQGYGDGQYGQNLNDRRQYQTRSGASPPRQKPRERLLLPTSPKTMPFDNPFPVFPAGQPSKGSREVDDAERAMAGLDINGRPSLDSKRPPTSSSQHSQNSGRPGFGRQHTDPRSATVPARSPQDQYGQRPSLDYRGPPGPPQRAMTMPQNVEHPGDYRRPNQPANGFPDRGYDVGGHAFGHQDPIAQRSMTSIGDRPGPMQPLQRPSTATGMRQGMSAEADFGRRPPLSNYDGPQRPGTSHGYRNGPNQMQRGQPPPMTKEAQLDAYMPDFDAQASQARPLRDAIGLPLDASAEAGMSPVHAQPPQDPAYDLRNARSQPNLRGQPNGQRQAGYGEPVPKIPPHDVGTLSGQGRSPLKPLVTDSSQMSRPPYSQASTPISPRQFHRPGAPPINRQGTAESGWSDPGLNSGRAAPNAASPVGQSGARSANPDALPAHPTPVRPGHNAARPGAASIRQEQAQRMSGDPRASLERPLSGPVTPQELHQLREAVKVKPQDQAQQLHFAKKLVEASSVLANDGGRADARTTQKNRENYIFEAHKIVKRLVAANYTEAMFYLADCYGTGALGLANEPKEAFVLYQGAAKLGHGPSAYRTAVCCEMGQANGGGTREDPLKAVQWYRRAAALGDVPAMYKLGMILLKGHLGQQANLGEAMIWLQRAADNADVDNPHALHELGMLYESAPPGGKIIRDERYAYELYTQAAKFGYKNSQCRLGRAYEYGQLGLPIDNRNSIHWYSKAAAQEDHDGELALSGWYLTGSQGILEQNDQEAYLWARKAALAENPKAEFAMGYFSETGIGCPKSFDDAKRWYGRAAAHRYPKARERLEELTRGGARGMRAKERISRSDPKKHEDCIIM